MRYTDHLPNRVPEFLQDEESDLHTYLVACGELFDALSDTIKEQDVYKDYRYVPEARLSLLARRFAFNPPTNLPSSLLRGIVRDLSQIYTTKGVEQSLTWVFRLIGWDSTIEHAWLLNPERYDPYAKVVYSDFYERDGLDNEGGTALNSFFPLIGEGYDITTVYQDYITNPSFILDGNLVIGRNFLISLAVEGGNPYITSVDRVNVDFDKLDYRNFVYGDAVDLSNGTFFTGRSYFSHVDEVKNATILGEHYRKEDIVKYTSSVISTPYIVVKVDSEDYERFTRPYVDENGVFYNYTDREKFRVAQTIIEYMLYEFIRPANVRIIMVTSAYTFYDEFSLSDDFSIESTATSITQLEQLNLSAENSSFVDVPNPVIGSPNVFVGVTSHIYGSGLMPLEVYTIGKMGKYEIQNISPEFHYDYIDVDMVDIGGGKFESFENMLIRTPSIISVYAPKNAALYGQETEDSDWVWLVNITPGTSDFRVFDYTRIKVTNYDDSAILSDGLFDVILTVAWEDRQALGPIQWNFQEAAIFSLAA